MTEQITKQGLLWGLTAICQLKGIPFSPELLLRRFSPPYDLVTLQHAAMELGLKVSLQSVRLKNIHPSSLPVLVVLRPTKTTELPSVSHFSPDASRIEQSNKVRFALVLKTDGERVLCLFENTTSDSDIDQPISVNFTKPVNDFCASTSH